MKEKLTTSTLISSLEEQKRTLQENSAEKKNANVLFSEIKEKKLQTEIIKADRILSCQELFDEELRNAIKQAAERRVDASYRDLIGSVDVLKKHINIITGVGNGETEKVIVIPGALYQKYSQEITPPTEVLTIKDNSMEKKKPTPKPKKGC